MNVRDEFSKLWGLKRLRVFFFLLLAVNFAVCYFLVPSEPDASYDRLVLEKYRKDPEGIGEYHKKLEKDVWDELRKCMNEGAPDDYIPAEEPYTFSGDPAVTDRMLLDRLTRILEKEDNTRNGIRRILTGIMENLEESSGYREADENSFAYRRLILLMDRYQEVLTRFSYRPDHERGWEALFGDRVSSVLLLLFLTVLGCSCFLCEQNGADAIIRASKHGRLRTAVSKLLAVSLCAALASLLTDLSSFAAILIKSGFSDPGNPVQVLELLIAYPFVSSVLGYLLLFLALRVLAAVVCTLIAAVLSVAVRDKLLSYLISTVCFGGFFALWLYSGSEVLAYLNPVSILNPSFLLKKSRLLNLFGYPFSYLAAAILLSVLLICVTGAVSCILFVRNGVAPVGTLRILRVHGKKPEKEKKSAAVLPMARRVSHGSLSLLGHEAAKLTGGKLTVPLVLAVTVLRVFLSVSAYTYVPDYGEFLYREYTEKWAGPVTQETREEIAAERARIEKAKEARNAMNAARLEKTVSDEAYSAYLGELNYARNHDPILKRVEAQLDACDALMAEDALRKDGDPLPGILYDTDWQLVFRSGPDLPLVLLLILLSSVVFPAEYESRDGQQPAASIVTCTKHGKGKVFAAKLLLTVLCALLLSVTFTAIDRIVISRNLLLPNAELSVRSISYFSSSVKNVTLSSFFIRFSLGRTLAAVLLALLTCILGALIRSRLGTAAVSVGITALPALAEAFGLTPFRMVSLWNALDFSRLWLTRIGNAGYLPFFFLGTATVCAAAGGIALLRYCRSFSTLFRRSGTGPKGKTI